MCALVALSCAMTQAQTDDSFYFRVYTGVSETTKGNVFISPFSIYSAMAMAYAGAAGDTAAEMQKAFDFPDSATRTELDEAFKTLFGELNAIEKNGGVKLSIANSIWTQQDYPFLKSYTDTLRDVYGAVAESVDFAKNGGDARACINAWVEEKTNDKIKNLIASPLPALTRMVLVNAIYLKGNWAKPFQKAATKDEPFFVDENTTVMVPMMRRSDDFDYLAFDDMQVLQMDYAGGEVSMILILPNEKGMDALRKVEQSFTDTRFHELGRSLRKTKMNVFLPRFKIEYGAVSLKPALEAMGMKRAFSSEADFSGMDGTRLLYISDVLHKAFVEVNEEGTEAAAATGVIMAMRAMPAPPKEFRADRPFIFIIRENSSKQILFIGRVANPAAE